MKLNLTLVCANKSSKEYFFKTLLAALFVCYSLTGLSQESGIYVTAADFKNGILKFASACSERTGNIKFRNKSIAVQCEREKINIRKSYVFAVRTCKDTFRIFDNAEFKIMNTDSIWLYSKAVGFGEDSYVYDDMLFFSVESDSDIRPLEARYLRKAFSDNQKFLRLVDSTSQTREKLGAYDEYLHKYVLISLYEKSIRLSK